MTTQIPFLDTTSLCYFSNTGECRDSNIRGERVYFGSQCKRSQSITMGRSWKHGSLCGGGSLWYNLTSYGLGSTELTADPSLGYHQQGLFLSGLPPSARLHAACPNSAWLLGDQVLKHMYLWQGISPLNHTSWEPCYWMWSLCPLLEEEANRQSK